MKSGANDTPTLIIYNGEFVVEPVNVSNQFNNFLAAAAH